MSRVAVGAADTVMIVDEAHTVDEEVVMVVLEVQLVVLDDDKGSEWGLVEVQCYCPDVADIDEERRRRYLPI
jgi:hypothetical protein